MTALSVAAVAIVMLLAACASLPAPRTIRTGAIVAGSTPGSEDFWFAPDDDVETAILDELNGAQASIHVQMYAFTLGPITNLLIAKHQAGLDVRLVLDSSQSTDPAEARQIQQLKAAGVPLVIGKSSKGDILHEKAVVLDGTTAGFGSTNWSASAMRQSNHWETDTTPSTVAAFEQEFEEQWTRLSK